MKRAQYLRKLREMTDKQLRKEYEDRWMEYFKEKGHSDLGTPKLEYIGRYKVTRRDIARILTIARQRGIDIKQVKKI